MYLISDLHLDHENIIKYCARPFVTVKEMNEVLVNNWNRTIGENSKVYFLGDMSVKRGKTKYWISKLNGEINIVKGNHDIQGNENLVLEYKGEKFLLTHDPDPWLGKFEGWIIHGHKHNNNLLEYPFINPFRKTVNVSVEVIGYKPIELKELYEFIKIAKRKKKILISNST
ncbi:MAG: hypothetical protein J7L39_01645 [Candidatus Aenigmarchaeota archaeon]|nr:hypothetical protein [Candidatus Aenigmarchaeota archaeon]